MKFPLSFCQGINNHTLLLAIAWNSGLPIPCCVLNVPNNTSWNRLHWRIH